MSKVRLGLDVDGVLANFSQAIIEKSKSLGMYEHFPCCWQHVNKWMFSERFGDVWDVIKSDEEFWLNISPFRAAQVSLQVVPNLYLTSRPVPTWVTDAWLRKNEFPFCDGIGTAVVTVSKPEDKLEVIRAHDIDVFVDDLIPTVEMLRGEGIAAFLYNAPYQCERDTSHLPKIYSLLELNEIIKMSPQEARTYAGLVV